MNSLKTYAIKLFTVSIMFLLLTQTICAEAKDVSYKDSVIYRKIVSLYEKDEQFIMMKQMYGDEYADRFLKNAYFKKLEEQEKGGGGNYCYANVKNIRQTNWYNCGPTTVLQTLYGIDSAQYVGGYTDPEKINTIESEYGVNSSGMMVYQIADALNKYSSGYGTYTYILGSNITEEEFIVKVSNSLTHGRPVILHAKTGYLDYYSLNTGHYINVEYIDRTSGTVGLVDCNYDSQYYGRHSVSIYDAYRAISAENGRYLIY